MKRFAKIICLFLLVFITAIAVFPAITHADASSANPYSGFSASSVKCNFIGSLTNPVFCTLNGIGYAIFSLINGLLAIIGWLFNIVINRTVFGFGAFFGGNAGIIAGWTVIRDVANIALLFGFIFLGITTILDLQQYEVKKTLPRLIIFAILLNFSLLASQAIIDTSNIFASTLYGQGNACATGDKTTCGMNQGISNSIMFESGAGSIFSLPNDTSPGFMFYMGASIFAIILMVVLLAGSILLITRAVVLAFLMILSPVGFAGLAIPPLEKYAKMWWDKLLSQSFFAPIFLLLIFVSLKIGATLTSGGGDLPGALTGSNSSSIDQILVFALIIGFLVASLMVAKQLGIMGAQFATNMATKAVSYPFAIAGRNTIGRGAGWLSKKWDAKMGQGIKADKGWAKALRGSGLDEVIAGGLGGVTGAKMGGFASYADRQKEMAERKRVTDRAANKAALGAAIDLNTPEGEDEVKKLLQQMNVSEIEQSEIIQKGTDKQIEAIARALSPEKFEQVMNNKEFAQDKLDKMAAARFATTDETNAKELTTKDLEQLAKANPAMFSRLTARGADGSISLREDQLEALGKSDRLTDTQRKAAYAATSVGTVDAAALGGDSTTVRNVMRDMSGEQKANLKASTFAKKVRVGNRDEYQVNADVIDSLDHNDLQALMEKKKLTSDARQSIIDKIKTDYDADPTTARMKAFKHYFDNNGFAKSQWGWDR